MNDIKSGIQFYQFPKKLLNKPVTDKAKIVYMIMYDMMRANHANDKKDDYIKKHSIQVRQKAIADKVGITERHARRIFVELEKAGLIERERSGNGITTYYFPDL